MKRSKYYQIFLIKRRYLLIRRLAKILPANLIGLLFILGLGFILHFIIFGENKKITVAYVVGLGSWGILLVLAIYTSIVEIFTTLTYKIVPYCQAQIEQIDTVFSPYGLVLAQNFLKLDKIALTMNLPPIAKFIQFYEDINKGQIQWCNAKEGVLTVSGLLSKIQLTPALFENADPIIGELKRAEVMLNICTKKNIGFCFLLLTEADPYPFTLPLN